MTKVYPDGIPEIKLSSKDDSLSKEKLAELTVKLKSQAESLVGNEMCFDLIEVAREFSEQLAKKGKTSFHSEMLLRQEERDKRAMDQQAILLQKNEEILQKQRKIEMEELEKKIREELKEKLQIQQQPSENARGVSSNEYFSFENGPIVVDGIEVNNIESFTNLSRPWTFGKILSVQSSENVKFDLKIVPLTHPFLQTFGGRRQLEMLLKNIKNHPVNFNENVSRCFGGSIDKENDRMLLLCESSSETFVTIENVLEQAGSLSIDRVIDYLKQICTGLVHLHSAGLTHRCLNLNCIILDGKRNVKIIDYLVHRNLSDLAKEHGIVFENFNAESIDSTWEAPENISKPNFHGKKVDIWSLGRITIQMIFGRDVLKCFPGGLNELLMSSQGKDLSVALKEFLKECFNSDSGARLTAEELLNCNLFKEPIGRDTNLISKDFKSKIPQETANLSKSVTNVTRTVNPTNSTSRYSSDFEELEFLGRGGFGSVVKVRNKIDDRFYAVKKIALDPRDIEYNKKILREVTTLSRLHHERIIRYYQAWIEEDKSAGESGDLGEDSDDYSNSNNSSSIGYTSTLIRSRQGRKNTLDLSLGPKSFKPFSGLEEFDDEEEEDSGEGSSEMMDFITFEGEDDSEEDEEDTETTSDSSTDSASYMSTSKIELTKSPCRTQVLYIQMEYCPNQTLRDLIDERASDPMNHFLDPPEIWRLFRQIVEGLVHIHAQGMMHRDLKPSNIFLDSNGDVKIGDFGLAVTRLESAVVNNVNNGRPESPVARHTSVGGDKSFTGESHTQNIGTPFYVSPEQMIGSQASSARYNQKVDMYALGIILIELWVPFKTGMERIQSLQKCRLSESILPPQLSNENVIKIAKKLLCHDPKQRFSSLELLRSDLLPPMLEEELIEDAMRGVAQPGAPHFPRLISTIFKRLSEMDLSEVRPKDFAFDFHSGNATELQVCEDLWRLKKEIERIFVKFGAVELDPPLLYIPLTSGSGETYSVLDDSGQRLELPGNLTRPFARWVAQSSLQLKPGTTLRRFAFDRVFRKISQVSGGQPYQPTEASFDLVHLEDERGLLELGEVVRVLFDSLMNIEAGKPEQFVFKFNHLKLRDRLIGSTGARKQQSKVEDEEVDQNFPGQSIQRMSPGALDDKLVRLLTPVKPDEPAETLLQRLANVYPDLKSTCFKEIEGLLTLLQKISVPPKVKIVFDPLFNGPRPDLYSNDICFVVLRETQGEKPRRYGGGVNYEAVACGGRYNQLVSRSEMNGFAFIVYRLKSTSFLRLDWREKAPLQSASVSS